MYATRTTQLIVGIFAILGIIALAILSLSLGKLTLLPRPGYTLYASFDNISGLKTGDQVQLAGVQVGKVVEIGLKDVRARVAMRVDEGVPIDADAIAAIKTSGIIGDKYVSIALGPSDRILRDGDTIRQTESAFVLEDAIGQIINSSGSSGESKDSKSSNSDKHQKPGKSEK
ncbi:outer membrane lipid asymmetry maintenance protein MlaD [Candidatus Binatus soli]|jgi:phospholipid/cholesterol/gamma-HCH transport system substrate-binding protein|uniref:outer membrane lipid asymmetry maintenance protein MlaD n=1 Tax=Candidatus Binatus soli TaxID=1953413 RepID=UPI003D0B6408